MIVTVKLGELAALTDTAIRRIHLDLHGRVVLTEAATGAYATTPVMAAAAGASRVYAWTTDTRFGTVADATGQTMALAAEFGVADRIHVSTERPVEHVRAADVVTNSGHVRPIDARFVAAMAPHAVVPLMFEAWEIQAGRFDVDLAALASRGIAVAGTNERHPDVGVFAYLGPMAERALAQAGVLAAGRHLVVLCDNPFEPYLRDGLIAAGAAGVTSGPDVARLPQAPDPAAVVVAMRPTSAPVLAAAAVAELAARWPGVPVVQFWGDLDRGALRRSGLPVWPDQDPGAGHMAVLPSDVGPEPVVRLQAGGLKVAEILLRDPAQLTAGDLEYLDEP